MIAPPIVISELSDAAIAALRRPCRVRLYVVDIYGNVFETWDL